MKRSRESSGDVGRRIRGWAEERRGMRSATAEAVGMGRKGQGPSSGAKRSEKRFLKTDLGEAAEEEDEGGKKASGMNGRAQKESKL
jgi:hypothetical protein